MRTFRYSSVAQGVDLNDPDGALVGQIADIRTHTWEYSLSARSLTGVSKPARETGVVAIFQDRGILEAATARWDADMRNGVPGVLEIDGWTQHAYVTGVKPDYVMPGLVRAELTIVLLDGWWRRGMTQAFNPVLLPAAQWLDYPYDYPHDFAPGQLGARVVNPSLTASPVKMVIYGPATNPYVVIGANRYQVDASVPAGGYLTVDGVQRSIVVTSPEGDRLDVFAAGHRGRGRDRGEYIFQPIPPGSSDVSWANGFGFDLTVFEERSTPPWT